MSQFMVCSYQHTHSHTETDANLLTQQPQTPPQTSQGPDNLSAGVEDNLSVASSKGWKEFLQHVLVDGRR